MNKQQKRKLGEQRAAQQREETRQSGLRAQARDRERRAKKQQERLQAAIDENNRLNAILATKKMALGIDDGIDMTRQIPDCYSAELT